MITKDTRSIFDVVATLPSGEDGPTLTTEELSAYLKVHIGTDAEILRNARHTLRDELYRDGGVAHMSTLIDNVFTDTKVRELRKKWIPYARFNNAIKRLVNELATVYSEPARRFVGEASNDNYQKLLEAVLIDQRMIEVSRLLNLHRALLVGFRVRRRGEARSPVIDVATPANVRAVLHPNDNTEVIGWAVRNNYRSARPLLDAPVWTLWTDHESMYLREDFSVIGDSVKIHGLGVCPWVPVTLGPPAPGFWPGSEGEDLVAAHVAIWFQNILTLKESKSATKQTIIQGDGTSMARGQAADSEVPNELADGQSATTVDMSMDLSMFRENSDHILRNVAQNYGISPALVEHQGVQSAQARELMRLPLRELRRQQQVPLRRFEHQLAIVMSAVAEQDLASDMHFVVDEWRMEFAESETPLDPMAEMQLFITRRGAGLDNTVDMLRRRYPGLSEDDALAIVAENVRIELRRNELMRPLQEISGSLGAEMPNTNTATPKKPPGEGGGTPAAPATPPPVAA